MTSITRDLIEYYGISKNLPTSTTSFTQVNKEDELFLKSQKADIEEIVKIYSNIKIKNTCVVKTPKGTSLEGVRLTGHKLLVDGEIYHKIQYVAANCNQSVHTCHFVSPFISFIILPKDFCTSSYVTATAFIEDIYAYQLNCRSIYTNTTILLNADIC